MATLVTWPRCARWHFAFQPLIQTVTITAVLRSVYLVIAVLLLISLLAVFISPASDLPETALRAYQAAILLLLTIVSAVVYRLLRRETISSQFVLKHEVALPPLPRLSALFCIFLC
jgi:hypothetical protein